MKSFQEIIKKEYNSTAENFTELIDSAKSLSDEYRKSYLYRLINEKLFQDLLSNKAVTKTDLRYVWDNLDDWQELVNLIETPSLVRALIENNIVTFKELIDKYKATNNADNDSCLTLLFFYKKTSTILKKNNKLTTENLKYLFQNIDSYEELDRVVANSTILNAFLSNFLIDLETAKKVDSLVSLKSDNDSVISSKLFDWLDFYCKDDKSLRRLTELNCYVYTIDAEDKQRDALITLVQHSRNARELLEKIVDNNLQDQYDSNTLLRLMTKDEEKKKIKMNF